ncbi:MAG: lipopolysaccharide biosynthesis protein [Phycisphaerae bacterium]
MMTQVIRQSQAKTVLFHGSLYMVSSLLVKCGGALLLPVYTHHLSPAEYAVFSNLMAIGVAVGLVISLYVDHAYARFFFDEEHDALRLRRLFSTVFLFCMVWGIVTLTVAFFILRNPTARFLAVPGYPHVLLACVIPFVMQMNALAAAHFRSQHRSTTVIIPQVLAFLLGACVSLVLLLRVHLGPLALLWGALANACVVWAWYYRILWGEGLIALRFSTELLGPVLAFSLGLLPLAASEWISGFSDRLLLTHLASLAQSGIYSVAFEVGRVMNVFVMSLFTVYIPMVFAMLKEDARKHIARIERFQAFYFHALAGLAFFLSILAPEIYRLLVKERYQGGVGLVPIIVFAFAIGGMGRLYTTLLHYHKLTLLISLGGVMHAVLNVTLNVLLIPHFGAEAAAWTKVVSILLVSAYYFGVSRKHQPLHLDWGAMRVTLATLGVCVAAFVGCKYALGLSFWYLLAAKGAILFLALAITWYSRFGEDLRRGLSRRAK